MRGSIASTASEKSLASVPVVCSASASAGTGNCYWCSRTNRAAYGRAFGSVNRPLLCAAFTSASAVYSALSGSRERATTRPTDECRAIRAKTGTSCNAGCNAARDFPAIGIAGAVLSGLCKRVTLIFQRTVVGFAFMQIGTDCRDSLITEAECQPLQRPTAKRIEPPGFHAVFERADMGLIECSLFFSSSRARASSMTRSASFVAADATPARRALQREHARRLATIITRPGVGTAAGDARALHRLTAKTLLARAQQAKGNSKLGNQTRAHLDEIIDTLDAALKAQAARTVG